MATSNTVPRVTLLALCFNHAAYALECLQSLSAQTWPNLEIVVLDNASADDSSTIIQQWAATCPHPVKLMLEKERRGICANVNRLMAQATGDFVALISTDDLWFPEKTTRQVELLQARGLQYGVAYADARRINEHGQTLEPVSFIAAHRALERLPEGDVLRELLRGPFIPVMSTLIRRQALQEMGPFDEALVYEDYDAWIRLAERWHFAADPTPLSSYRILSTSMIHTVAAQHQPAKLLSDARIMAKASRNPNLEEKIVLNLHRRVLRLASEVASLTPDNSATLLELFELTPLPGLRVLAALQRISGPLPLAAIQARLQQAENSALPQTDDAVAWQQFFHSLDSPSPSPKRWWPR